MTARIPRPPDTLSDLVRAAAERALDAVDVSELPRLMRRVDRAALLGMARTLRGTGLFRNAAGHSEEEIAAGTGVAARHRWILRRWLAALCRDDLLSWDENRRRFHTLRPVTRAELRAAVGDLDAAGAGLGYPPPLRLFFQRAIGHLPQLLRDEVQLQALLFADGESETAEGAYRDNWVNRYLNAAAAEVARWAAGTLHGGQPLRVLEIGAGVGGTTLDVLDMLDSDRVRVDYLFTDVSRYFLDRGAARFGHRAGMRFGPLDLNATPMGFGVTSPASHDVIIAANVLHNADDIGRCLRDVHDLLAPGGLLICIDTCRELSQILTSMQFLMSPRPDRPRPGQGDFRAGGDQIFLTREQWTGQLRVAGLSPVLTAPIPGHPLDEISVTLFAAQKSDTAET